MFKKTLLTFLLAAAVSQAAVKELIPQLTSKDLNVQTQARLDLLAACSKASSPDASEADRKAICVEICEVLNSRQPVLQVIQPMLNNLERIGGEESVPTLAKLMNHQDEHIRNDARRALVVNPSNAAAQALGAQLKSRKSRSDIDTAGLIYALGERNQAGASKLIVGALKSSSQEIFLAAVITLGRLNEDIGVEALLGQRAKEEGYRKVHVDAALLATNRKEVFKTLSAASDTPDVQSSAFLGLLLLGETGKAANAMSSGNAALQLAVIEAALQGKDKQICDLVAANLGTLPPHIQLQALGALEFSGNRAYAKAVEPLLKSKDYFVQDNAASALARIGTADSVKPLLANGRGDARRALGQLNVEGVDAALETIAKSGDENGRAVAIEALAIRGRKDLMPAFFKYADEESKVVSKGAVKAIGMIGNLSNLEQLTQLMISREKSPVSRDILNAIVEIMRRSSEPGKAVNILVDQMTAASPRSQANILQALVQTGSDEALKPVAKACTSSDEQLQKSAVKMLGGWKQDNALPTMIKLAADESMSLSNHVTLMRGCSRLLAGQRRLDKELAQQALDAGRRPEEKKLIQDVIDQKK
ncbi:HEAT repeat domain-containing protein [Pontiellaceae bacterium B12227]|nr:HEAT repeat domain-containing protein [Pontiellaceae bacterium B12227]